MSMKHSAGIVVYRRLSNGVEIMIAHQGGPFWGKKDKGAWSFPKGEFTDEDRLTAAKREFQEEIGQPAPAGEYVSLGSHKSHSKTIYLWAVESDLDVSQVYSNMAKMEWPPKSGNILHFPEVDRAKWVAPEVALELLSANQHEFVHRLADLLSLPLSEAPEQESLF